MTISPAERRPVGWLLTVLLLAGCGREAADPVAADPGDPGAMRALVGPARPVTGDTVTITLELPAGATVRPLVALQGSVSFDPGALRYLGQPVTGHLVMVGQDTSGGKLQWLALARDGLPPRALTLAFERRRPAPSLPRLTLSEAVGEDGPVPRLPSVEQVARETTRPLGALRRLTAEDWLDVLGLREPPSRWAHVAGDGLIYGDANLSGTITGADYVAISNVAVGNLPLLAAANRDYAIAANVTPANLPGLGEAGDPLPPGRNPDGSFTISASDASIVANHVIGLPVAIVGQPVPGRVPAGARAVLADTIAADRVLSRDTIYEIHGKVVVGSPLVPDVTLTIEAGTRLEGDPASRAQLIIRRGANLMALGTRLQPIVFSCRSDAPAAGCWGGVVINGFGVLNNGSTEGGGGVGFPGREGLGGSGRYGGNLPEDSSGALRYVRIEYAGAFPANAADRLPGLQLLGAGSRTVIDSVQVFAAAGDGVLLSGGTVNLRAVLVSDAGRDGVLWRDGWQGAAQFLVVQQGANGRHALHGINLETSPDAAPRSAPLLSHVTLTGPEPAPIGTRAVLLEHGSAGVLANAVIVRSGAAAFDVQGGASCALLGTAIQIRTSIVFNAPGLDAVEDGDCADESGELEAAGRDNRRVDPRLVSPLTTLAPDWRPAPGAPAGAGAAPIGQPSYPPTFFISGIGYVGAVPPANAFGSNVPWYAGWTRTF